MHQALTKRMPCTQPYGAYGYRPLGSYRAYRSSPGYVYVPDAKVISID
jgi:hypothetical protein